MKNSILRTGISTFLLSFIALTAIAQGPPMEFDEDDPKHQKRKERIEALKVSYITERLDLSSAEAQVFWPVYNDFRDAVEAIRKEGKEFRKANQDDMTEEDMEAMVQKRFELEQRSLNLKIEYHEKFKEVLPLEKVVLLYQAERDFVKEVLKQMKGKGPNSGPR